MCSHSSLKFIKEQIADKDSSPYQGSKCNELNYGVSGALYDLLWHGIHSAVKKDSILQTLHEVVVSEKFFLLNVYFNILTKSRKKFDFPEIFTLKCFI